MMFSHLYEVLIRTLGGGGIAPPCFKVSDIKNLNRIMAGTPQGLPGYSASSLIMHPELPKCRDVTITPSAPCTLNPEPCI